MKDLDIRSTIDIDHGVHMPRLGLGTYKTTPDEAARDAVVAALRSGYRSIDTASLYGNEDGIGEGIRLSGVSRDEIFLTTKVWNDEQGYDSTLAALERSLSKLGTDHVDLYLVHWPMRDRMADTWRAMERLLEQGMTRAIGVCNHLPHHLEALLRTAHEVPAVDQVEFHFRLQQPALQAFLAEHGIVLEAWAPLMKGRIAEVPEVVSLAERLGKTPAQVAIRWILEIGAIAIPKSVHADRIAENRDVFDFSLSDEDHERLTRLDMGERLGPDPDTYAWEG